MAGEYIVQTQSIVNVQITSSITDFPSERRFQKDLTIGQMKVSNSVSFFAFPISLTLSASANDHSTSQLR